MKLKDAIVLWAGAILARKQTLVTTTDWVSAAFSTPSMLDMIREGYKANAAVFACVKTLSQAFPQGRLAHYRGERSSPEEVPNSPITKLLRRPCQQMSQSEWLKFVMCYTAIGGEVFLEVIESAVGVAELRPYHSGHIEVVPVAATSPFVTGFKYRDIGGEDRLLPVERVIHWRWMVDPEFPYKGLSPIRAVSREVDQDNEGSRYVFALLKNDAIPRIVVSAPVDSVLTDEMIKRQRTQWKEMYGGANRGAPAVLEPGWVVSPLSVPFGDMGLKALRDVTEARICSAFGVPPMLVDLPAGLAHSTYSNKEQASLDFVEGTMTRLWNSFSDELTQGLRDRYRMGEDEWIGFDLSNVPALQERVAKNRVWALDAFSKKLLRRDEARALSGLTPVGGEVGDEFNTSPPPALPAPTEAPPKAQVLSLAKALLGMGITDEDVDAAVRLWNRRASELPYGVRGLLEAEVVDEVAQE